MYTHCYIIRNHCKTVNWKVKSIFINCANDFNDHFIGVLHCMTVLHPEVTYVSEYHVGFITFGAVGPAVNQALTEAV